MTSAAANYSFVCLSTTLYLLYKTLYKYLYVNFNIYLQAKVRDNMIRLKKFFANIQKNIK